MAATLRATKDYRIFELHEFNRDAEKLKRLEASMRSHGYIDAYPMHVVRNGGGKLKIKAGHHRFVVAQRLGIPVKFVVCDDNASIHELERATVPWSANDYLTSYVRNGIPAYIAVKQYIDETGIPLGLAASLVGGECASSHNKMESFKDGNYKMGDQTLANRVKDVILHMKKCGIGFASNSYLVQALSKAMRVREFSDIRLKEKFSSHAATFEKQPNVLSYLDAIEAIYNRMSRDRLPIAFLAQEESRRRMLFKDRALSG